MKRRNISQLKKQTGHVFIIVALSLVVSIGCVGLAIDSGLGYMVKAKLNAAVDSAALAAVRAVAQGDTEGIQRANAQAAAQKFFAANYPAGYLGSSATFPVPTVTFGQNRPGEILVNTSATASLPVTFMRVLGFNTLGVSAAAETTRRDLDMAFVIDTSGSMNPSRVQVRDNAILFLKKFNSTNDRMALIHFSYGAEVDVPIRPVLRGFDLATMSTAINNFNFSGLTNSAEGFWQARDQLKSVASPSSLRVIVFFSDGAPNSLSSIFTFKNPADCPTAGTIVTGDGTVPGTALGLWKYDKQDAQMPGKCYVDPKVLPKTTITKSLAAAALPAWYNAHNPTNAPALQEFRLAPSAVSDARTVTNNTSSEAMTWNNVNRASRNLVEAMAAKARSEGIYVLTLGLGSQLTTKTGPDKESGDGILKCMANTADAKPSCVAAGAGQPVGIYCQALDANALKPCFDKIASSILRISK